MYINLFLLILTSFVICLKERVNVPVKKILESLINWSHINAVFLHA